MNQAMVWGASGGIGRAVVARLREKDWTVVGVFRDPENGTTSANISVAADVGDPESVSLAVREAGRKVDNAQLWVYAVGDILSTRVQNLAPGDWDRILSANLSGAYLATHFSLPLLSPDAHLVFLGGVSERLRLPGLTAYASAKAGIEAFTDALRKEQRSRRVTLIRPKAVDTTLWDKVPFSVPHGALRPDDVAQRILIAHRDGESGVIDL